MKIAVIGAGIAGLSAAYDLLAAGHEVVIYEAANHAGGLAAGFRDERWEWPLEKFYHHLFTSDDQIIALVKELGMEDQTLFPAPNDLCHLRRQDRAFRFTPALDHLPRF